MFEKIIGGGFAGQKIKDLPKEQLVIESSRVQKEFMDTMKEMEDQYGKISFREFMLLNARSQDLFDLKASVVTELAERED